MRKWLPRILAAVAIVFAAVWAFYPWVSQLSMLTPCEAELHTYERKIGMSEPKLVQAYDMLAKDPTDQNQLAEVIKQSKAVLATNEEFWVTGMPQPIWKRFMYKIRFMEPPAAYLPTWPGPKTDEGKVMMAGEREDTATLMAYAWNQKEDGNAMASQLLATFDDGSPATQEEVLATADVVATAKASKGSAEYVYKKWKGNYRPPLSIFR